MKRKRFGHLWLAGILLILVSLACSSLQAPTPTAVPTNTSTATSVPTATARPTNTPWPTATPNLAATQVYADFYSEVQDYFNKGYISSTDGSYYKLDDFSQEWAQINWYQWWNIHHTVANFVLDAHFKWSTASPTPETSGCGFIFALQDNKDNYAVFLDTSRILFLQSRILRGQRAGYEVGKTRGTGRVDIEGDPAEADFSLAVDGNIANINVNKEFIGEYTLSQDSIMNGQLAYTLLSGTNKGYGTRCDMTDVKLWVLK